MSETTFFPIDPIEGFDTGLPDFVPVPVFLPTSYMLVMWVAMTKEDRVTYGNYPERYGRCSFCGAMGLCKIVPTDGPTRVYPEEKYNIASTFLRTATFLNTYHLAPNATAFNVAAAAMGRPTDENLYDPETYEEAILTHPTADDIGAAPDDLVSALLARLVTR